MKSRLKIASVASILLCSAVAGAPRLVQLATKFAF
jgi:hypothetical protein